MHKTLIVLVVLLAVLLAACQPTTTKSEFSAEQVCKDLLLFKTSLENLREMEATASPAEFDAQLSVVRQNFMNLTQSVANLEATQLAGVDEALTNLAEAREMLPEDVPTQEVLVELEDEIEELSQALEEVNTELECVK
jgi:uncharacterized protein (DUF342 family)